MTPWTVTHQTPLTMGFSRQYWSELPFPSPGDLPNPGVEPKSPVLQEDSLLSEPPGKPHRFFVLNTKKKEKEFLIIRLFQVIILDLLFFRISFCCKYFTESDM